MKRILLLGLVVGLLTATARGEIDLVEGRLSADALLWANCHWKQSEKMGLTDSRFDFYCRAAFVGLTGRINSVASTRVRFDVGGVSADDLFVDFRWPSGFGLRAGQFIPPLGFEAWTEPSESKFVSYSIVKRHWKPKGPRDIGFMARYDGSLFGFAGALLNGSGSNRTQDDNDWKDVCGRAVFRPWASQGPTFACRGYYGRIGEEGIRFWNIAGELLFDCLPLQIFAEAQRAVWGTPVRTSFCAQAACRFLDVLEPVARCEIEFRSEDKFDYSITGGVNFCPWGDRVRVMLDYSYRRQASKSVQHRTSSQAILLQLQGAM